MILAKVLPRNLWIVIGVFILALLPRYWLLSETVRLGLNVDELQSVVHAYLPLPDLFKSVYIFDPHPPLYYIQLHYWLYLGGVGDMWIKSNSILWSVLTVIGLFVVGEEVHGQGVGSVSAVLYALAPFSIAYAQEVRMYALLMFLSVWVYYFTWKFIQNTSLWAGFGLLISSLAFLYSQGAGFLIFTSSISCAFLLFNNGFTNRAHIIKWAIIQFIVLACYLPWLLHARAINVGHPLAPKLEDIAYTFAQFLFGVKIVLINFEIPLYVFSVFTMLCIVMIVIYNQEARIIGVSFLLLPILFCIVVSYIIKPIWLTRTLVQISPFISLAITVAFFPLLKKGFRTDHRRKFMIGLTAMAIFVFLSVTGIIYQQYHYLPWSNLRNAVELVEHNIAPSDVIYLPNERLFWGWCWYDLYPGSVNPLQTNYTITKSQGQLIVSKESVQSTMRIGQTYWLVYRSYDNDINDFFIHFKQYERELVKSFRDVTVEKIVIRQLSN